MVSASEFPATFFPWILIKSLTRFYSPNRFFQDVATGFLWCPRLWTSPPRQRIQHWRRKKLRRQLPCCSNQLRNSVSLYKKRHSIKEVDRYLAAGLLSAKHQFSSKRKLTGTYGIPFRTLLPWLSSTISHFLVSSLTSSLDDFRKLDLLVRVVRYFDL